VRSAGLRVAGSRPAVPDHAAAALAVAARHHAVAGLHRVVATLALVDVAQECAAERSAQDPALSLPRKSLSGGRLLPQERAVPARA
jgi:hypothetical protein